VAAKPFQHDAVRLLRRLLEDGVAATRQHDEFGSAQFALQLNGGTQTDRAVAITPHQRRWNSLDSVESGSQLGHLGEPAANNAEAMGQCTGPPKAINNFLQTSVDNAVGASINLSESDALDRRGR
jgi:hypothetical protein